MEKLREAKEKQIRFISDFHYPGDTKLNAFDLSVILNNALDNCMENVSGETFPDFVVSGRSLSL